MKKLIVCFALAAFAALPVFAGEKCCKDKNKVACADKAKAECASKSACSKTPSKQTLLSPKAAELKKS
ncbi:MAG: hypothetical protein ABIR24_09695 [Verrucomicrobiota bacterium]